MEPIWDDQVKINEFLKRSLGEAGEAPCLGGQFLPSVVNLSISRSRNFRVFCPWAPVFHWKTLGDPLFEGPFKVGTTAASFPGLTNEGNLEMISEVKISNVEIDFGFNFILSCLSHWLGLVASNIAWFVVWFRMFPNTASCSWPTEKSRVLDPGLFVVPWRSSAVSNCQCVVRWRKNCCSALEAAAAKNPRYLLYFIGDYIITGLYRALNKSL